MNDSSEFYRGTHLGPPLAPLEIIHFTIISCCFVLSLVGCVLMVILMNTPKYSERSYSVYLRFLVISDAVYSFISTAYKADSIVAKLLGNDILFVDSFRPFCALVYALQMLFQATSLWFLVGLSVDRFIAVVYPFKQATMCTIRRAKIACAAIVVLCLIAEFGACFLMVYKILYFDTCYSSETVRYSDLALNVNTVFAFVIPVALVTAFNTAIIHAIKRSTYLRSELSAQERKTTTSATVALVVVCLVSVVTMLPMSVYYAVILLSPEYAIYSLFYPANMFRAINYCSNFYSLMLTGAQYRADMAERLCRRHVH